MTELSRDRPHVTTPSRAHSGRQRKRVRPKSWGAGLLFLLLAFALLAAGCRRIASPQGWAPPHIEDGTLYVSIERGKMAALDADDLSVQWVFPPNTDEGKKLKLEGIYAAPIVHGATVYFGAYDDYVYALEADVGAPFWRFKTSDPVIGALSLRDETIFAGSTDGRLYAIDATTGIETDRFDTGSSIWASPLLVGDVIYVPTMDGTLYALDADTLDPIGDFAFDVDAGLLMDPTLARDDTLLVGGINSTLYAIDPDSGEEKWSFEGGNWFWGRPLIDGDTIYIGDLDGNVNALDLDNGDKLWSETFQAEAAVRSAPLLAGDTLVIVDRSGNVYGLNPEDGTPRDEWPANPNTGERLVALGKTVLSDPFLLERAATPDTSGLSPSETPAESPAPTEEPSPTSAAGGGTATEVLIVAQGGDLCRLDPADGSPVVALLCAEVPS